MKPDSSPIILSSSGLVLPCSGTEDVFGQQFPGAHSLCENEEINPTEPVWLQWWHLQGGGLDQRGEQKLCEYWLFLYRRLHVSVGSSSPGAGYTDSSSMSNSSELHPGSHQRLGSASSPPSSGRNTGLLCMWQKVFQPEVLQIKLFGLLLFPFPVEISLLKCYRASFSWCCNALHSTGMCWDA